MGNCSNAGCMKNDNEKEAAATAGVSEINQLGKDNEKS